MNNFITEARRIKVFDIEGDGLAEVQKEKKDQYLPEISRIWCIVVEDLDGEGVRRYGPDRIDEAIADLLDCDALVGHNILDYDWRVIERFYGPFPKRPELIDTLVISRCQYPDPQSNPRGGNGLEAWGEYLDFPKGDFKDFSKFSEEMLNYCQRDVALTAIIFLELNKWLAHMQTTRRNTYKDIIHVEHQFAFQMARQCEFGINFNVREAEDVLTRFQNKAESLRAELQEVFPPRIETMKRPAYYIDQHGVKWSRIKDATASGLKRADLTNGPPETKVYPFNPDSRQECIARLVERYNWQPEVFTDNGNPKLDEKVLESLDYPEAAVMKDYLTIGKRISQLSDYIARVPLTRDGKLHGFVNHYGAKTGRCSHSQPNLAQVPKVSKPYGQDFRRLFTAPEGWVMVGADAKGLELRTLANRMAKYDSGEYAEIVCNSDPHTENQKAANLDSRDAAKTLIYAINYGAGDAKVGSIVKGGKAEGRRIKADFFGRFPAIQYVMEEVQTEARTYGSVRLVDGRAVPVRSEHAALNDALQGDGAVLMKHALLIAVNDIRELKLRARPVLNVHDEFQFVCPEDEAKVLAEILERSFERAGQRFECQCPIEGEARIGKNWAETH